MPGTQYAVHTEHPVLSPAAFMDFRYEVNRRLQGGATTQARILWGSVVEIRHTGSPAGVILGGFPELPVLRWAPCTVVGCHRCSELHGGFHSRSHPGSFGQVTMPATCGFLRVSCDLPRRFGAPSELPCQDGVRIFKEPWFAYELRETFTAKWSPPSTSVLPAAMSGPTISQIGHCSLARGRTAWACGVESRARAAQILPTRP